MKTRHLLLIPIAAALPILGVFAEDTGKNVTTTGQVNTVSNSQSATGKDQASCKCDQTEAELDKLIADMNNASPEKKLDAIAAVVSKLSEKVRATQQKCENQNATSARSSMDMCKMMMSH
jgi:hypothetical protein